MTSGDALAAVVAALGVGALVVGMVFYALAARALATSRETLAAAIHLHDEVDAWLDRQLDAISRVEEFLP